LIETERLLLRDWRDGDLETFIRHTNTPAVMRWLGGVNDPERLLERLQVFARWQEERGFTFWVVERKADGELIGFCGLKIATTRQPRVGERGGWRLARTLGAGLCQGSAVDRSICVR
jgi:RimJ/RimL family protein N-acetyltransferase